MLNHTKKSILWAILCLSFSSQWVAASNDNDGHSVQVFNIPRQPLSGALIDFSKQVGRVVVAVPSLLKDKYSTAVVGYYSPEEALALMLSSTGFDVLENDQYGYTILKPAPKLKNEPEQKVQAVVTDEETFVLGRAREHRAANYSASVSVVDKVFLADNRVVSLKRLGEMHPALAVSPHTEDSVNIVIRGIKNYGASHKATQPIATHYNDVYLSGSEIIGFSLFDVDYVEVVKGATFSTAGHSAVAGAVNIAAAEPRLGERNAEIQFTLGSYNQKQVQAMVNIPINPTLSLRFAGLGEKHDGYTKTWDDYAQLYEDNTQPILNYPRLPDSEAAQSTSAEKSSYDDRDVYGWRASGLWKITPHLNWLLQYDQHKNNSHSSARIDPYIINHFERAVIAPAAGQINSDLDIFASNINFDHGDLDFNYQYGQSEFSFTELGSAGISFDTNNQHIDLHQKKLTSHNVQIASRDFDDPTEWLAGIYIEHRSFLSSWGAEIISQKDITRDLYGQLSYRFSSKWTAYTGFRYNTSEQKIESGPSAEWSKPMGSLSLGYEFGSNAETRLSLSQGYRPGIAQEKSMSEEHTSKNIEWQWSGRVLDDQLDWSASLYYTRHTGMHAWEPSFNENNAVDGWFVQGAAQAQSKGLDFELEYSPHLGGITKLSFTYLDAEIVEFDQSPWPFPSELESRPLATNTNLASRGYRDLSGNKMPYAPQYSVVLSYKYDIESRVGTFTPRLSVAAIDEYYLDVFNRNNYTYTEASSATEYQLTNISRQPRHNNIDASINWLSQSKIVQIEMFFNNITDEKVRAQAYTEFYSSEGFVSNYKSPRTYGIAMTIKI